MNILNKDGKQHVIWGGSTRETTKSEHHEFCAIGESGRLEWIDKDELNIDGDYQRPPVSERKILKIAKDWDWKLLGTLSVAKREDGSYWIYDGGHRCRAAFLRPDVRWLPCAVFDTAGKKEEAQAFVEANTTTTAVGILARHRAALMAGDATAAKVQTILNKHHYAANSHNSGQHTFCALAQLYSMVKLDYKMATEVFDFCVTMGGVPTRAVLGAIFTCERKVVGGSLFDDPVKLEKIRVLGIDGITAAINREVMLQGKGGPAIGAKAILDIVNKKTRKKLSFN